MYVSYLGWQNFRNLQDGYLTLGRGVISLRGRNGAGKSNLMECIHFLCKGNSNRTFRLKELIKWGSKFLRVEGRIGDVKNSVYLDSRRKVIKVDGKRLKRISRYYGRYGVVSIGYRDVFLIGDRNYLRFFFNHIIGSFYPVYVELLSQYRRILLHRNSILKRRNRNLLSIVNERFLKVMNALRNIRERFLRIYQNYVNLRASELGIGTVEISFHEDDIDDEKELELGYTVGGPHRGVYSIRSMGRELRFLSTGERSSVLLSLKLGESTMYNELKGTSPILLVDDVSGFLDSERLRYLYRTFDLFDQVFITGEYLKGTRILIDEGKVIKNS